MNTLGNWTGNTLYADTIKLHYKKNRTMQDAIKEHEVRKENPALDQMLYDADKADLLGEMCEAKNLLMKMARGEELTESEKKFIKENYPEFVEKAERAKTQADAVKEKLKNASSKKEKQDIISQAYSMVGSTLKADPTYGELLGESIKAAIAKEDVKESTLGMKQEVLSPAEELRRRFEQDTRGYSLFESKQ